MERQHGRIAGGEMAVIGMGKLGGREMTANSDLDLIVIYRYGARQDSLDRPEASRRRPNITRARRSG